MKSFLQEIEEKFFELEEQKSPEEIESSTVAMKDYAAATRDAAAASEEFGDSLTEDQLCEKCGGKAHEGHCHNEAEEIDEMSTTAAVAPVTGKYFIKDKKKKNKITYEVVQEAMDRKYERLIESYRKFSLGEKNITPKRKVERTIQEVSKKLREIETIVNHTNKLKIESGMSRDNYGPRTEKALNKISEKLIKIAERVRAIGE
jgi:hypothetical protein